MIKIILLGNPKSTQHIYSQRGHIKYMTKEAKKVKQDYIEQIEKQYDGDILECEVNIVVELYFGDKRRRDWDNYHKISMDALEGIILKDDSQIQTVLVKKNIDPDNPRIEIFINQ